ncbi:hypothetical protein SAMN06265222_101704 [Neorhodopirellula lusitana]|uniref:HAMP domain-containing protein n=1 Tax=Neorhodopirellula lusitana TaxID=445327 RepID=A0ABY1PUF9_9BACT|nr:hypothetical protein [Neorhodopirellula lusitana]SMP42070.1 hypothetical protein SAMN06265222_101704 [Neorhodopirellula lusitana]
MSNRPTRQQLLVEHDVQVSLTVRSLLYGAASMTYFTVIQFFTQSMNYPGMSVWDTILSLADEAIFWVPGFFLLGPLMVYDMLRITNRVAGPIFAMRRQLEALRGGEDGRALKFRNDDYWDQLAGEFNAVRQELLDLRAEKSKLVQEATVLRSEKAESAKAAEAGSPVVAAPAIDSVIPQEVFS